MKAIKLKHGSPEWLEFRKSGIGGSDASAILGCNPYKSNVSLWEEKCGLKEPKPITCAEAVEYGLKAEKPLVELFKLDYPEYKVIIPKNKVYIHDNGFMFASLDGELEHKKAKVKGILEVKTSTIFASMHREKWADKIPQNYYIQVLHYLAVTGYEYAILKAHLISSDDDGNKRITTKHYYIDAEDVKEDIDFLIEKETEFWQSVKDKKRPMPLLPEF